MNHSALVAITEAIGWMLLHSTWQFTIIAILAFCVDRVLINRSSSLRYCVLLSTNAASDQPPQTAFTAPAASTTLDSGGVFAERSGRRIRIPVSPLRPPRCV